MSIASWLPVCLTVMAIAGSRTPEPMPPPPASWLGILSTGRGPAKLAIDVFGFGFAAAAGLAEAGRTVVSRVTGVFGASSRPQNRSLGLAFGFGTNFCVR